METHIMTDTHRSLTRRLMPRRGLSRTAAIFKADEPKPVTSRTWPAREYGLNPDPFELRVFGAVRRTLELDESTLKSLPSTSLEADLDSRSIRQPKRVWTGASLLHLLRMTDMEPEAMRVTLFSEGGYYTRFALHELLRKNGVLAYEVDGRPLTRSEGGPVRLVLPRIDPWRCSKWVRAIQLEEVATF